MCFVCHSVCSICQELVLHILPVPYVLLCIIAAIKSVPSVHLLVFHILTAILAVLSDPHLVLHILADVLFIPYCVMCVFAALCLFHRSAFWSLHFVYHSALFHLVIILYCLFWLLLYLFLLFCVLVCKVCLEMLLLEFQSDHVLYSHV